MPFELKNASSQFQKTMVTLFQLLLANALIYVNDILLFSKDADSHEKLLTEFYNLVKSQGTMLSEKKMVIGQTSIEFLGMTISNRKYTLQPYIASSLKEFPNKLSSAKQIQQFLGIVNYMFDFIPKISKYRNCLTQLLKKNPPEWNSLHMEAIQQLKKIAEKLPLLQIPGPGKRILQIDASDDTGQQPFLKKMMERGTFVDIKVVHSGPQKFITIPHSKKYL